MLEKFNELDKIYGRLTVIERAENYADGSAQWYCKCSCGNEKKIKVRASALRSGHTKSCGCLVVDTTIKIHKNKIVSNSTRKKMSKAFSGAVRMDSRSDIGKKYPERGKYNRGSIVVRKINCIINNARRRNISFEISREFAAELIVAPCYYCGTQSKIEEHKKCSGIDRIDNNKGYADDNCVSCCFFCNSFKNDRSFEEFKLHATRLYNNLCTGEIIYESNKRE